MDLPAGSDGIYRSEAARIADLSRTLVEDQRLDQPTFHSLYEAMPRHRAELINGVVYMPGLSALPALSLWSL